MGEPTNPEMLKQSLFFSHTGPTETKRNMPPFIDVAPDKSTFGASCSVALRVEKK